MKKNKRRKKEAQRRIIKTIERESGDADKTDDGEKILITPKRSKTLSVASQKVLREDASSRNPAPGFSEFMRNKLKNSPITNLPTDPEEARAYARTHLRACVKN